MTNSPDDDTELTADEVRSLQRLEQFMRDRGYRRDRHGFWRLPGEQEYLAIQYAEQDED